jgi:hypothetical protein
MPSYNQFLQIGTKTLPIISMGLGCSSKQRKGPPVQGNLCVFLACLLAFFLSFFEQKKDKVGLG